MTSFPPTTANSVILFRRMAVGPMILSKIYFLMLFSRQKKIPQDDVFTVYKQGKVAYQKIGSLDMSSIRRITDMVVDLGF